MSDASKHVEAMIIALDRNTGYTVNAAALRLLLASIKQLEQQRDEAQRLLKECKGE
jgi:hypothetical protein